MILGSATCLQSNAAALGAPPVPNAQPKESRSTTTISGCASIAPVSGSSMNTSVFAAFPNTDASAIIKAAKALAASPPAVDENRRPRTKSSASVPSV